jgi:hypothetical protein
MGAGTTELVQPRDKVLWRLCWRLCMDRRGGQNQERHKRRRGFNALVCTIFVFRLSDGSRSMDPLASRHVRGLESAPIGVITRPGTKNPKYSPTE